MAQHRQYRATSSCTCEKLHKVDNSGAIVRKVVTRTTAGTAPPVPGNLPRVAQCCCHAAVTNRSSEPLSFVFLNLQALRASVIHVSCLRERWKVEGVFHDKSDNVTSTNKSD